jgi:hypothetical protein
MPVQLSQDTNIVEGDVEVAEIAQLLNELQIDQEIRELKP